MRIQRSGYWYVFRKDHPRSNKQGYIAEHRLVMEKSIGRFLSPEEAVHHINHIRTDNHIENLKLFSSRGLHTKHGHPEIIEAQKILFKGQHFSLETEFKKGHTPMHTFEKGKPAWNKGKAWSMEMRKKLSDTQKGTHGANGTSFAKGRIPWNKGLKKIK